MPETTKFSSLDDNASSDGTLKPNDILLARYKILEILGAGGYGAVYQARDLNFPEAKRLVAVKEMLVTASDPNLRAQTMKTFRREANILATLSHPAIPRIYDFFDKNDRAYLVMEYINGKNLEEVLQLTKGPLPIDKILEWSIDLCDVLYYLHSYQPESIIFRDMKPANIMIDSLGKARLIDFGIAKVFVSGVKGTSVGTEGYSAPEQYKGNATPMSDVYGLGATLHHVISRKDPRIETPFSFTERPLKQYNPDISPDLEAVIYRALEMEPQKRFQDCMEMKQALEDIRYNRPTAGAAKVAGAADNMTTSFNVDATIQPKWVFEVEDEIRSSAVVFKDQVFFGSYDTNIWCLNLATGAFNWKYATEGGIASIPVVDNENRQVLVGSEDGYFYALSLQGQLNWKVKTNDKIRSTARVAHGHLFFGSDDGHLYSLIAGSGRQLWSLDVSGAVRSCPAVNSNRIIIGTEIGEVIGLELSGVRKWTFRTKRAVSSSPFIDDDGVCYVGSFDNHIYAIDVESGYSHWRLRTGGPVISSPVVSDKYVVVGSTDGKLYCVNSQTGKEKWTLSLEKPIVASPIVKEDIVYIGTTDGRFYAVDMKTGKELWKFTTEGSITSAANITGDTILVTSMDRKIYALPLVSY